MCRTCLGSVTFSCCFNLTQSHTMLPWCTLPPGPPRHRHVDTDAVPKTSRPVSVGTEVTDITDIGRHIGSTA